MGLLGLVKDGEKVAKVMKSGEEVFVELSDDVPVLLKALKDAKASLTKGDGSLLKEIEGVIETGKEELGEDKEAIMKLLHDIKSLKD